jgi:hypothetical protein
MQKATVGGILSIAASIIGILTGLFFLFYPLLLKSLFNDLSQDMTSADSQAFDQVMGMMMFIFIAVFLFYLIIGILGIIGGVCAIKKQKFGLALAGAIASSISFYYLGIVAVVLVSMAQSEFNKPVCTPVALTSVTP